MPDTTSNKMHEDLYDAIIHLQRACDQHMLPLESVGFYGDIGLVTISGVSIHNTQLDEIGREDD